MTNFRTIVKRALAKRCPNCGEGKLFSAYLKPVDKCSVCSEEFGHIRADDGPAWLSVLVVGHIVVPGMFFVMSHTNWPDWLTVTVWSIVAFILILAFLPYAKALFIGIIWRTKCVGSERENKN